MAPQRSEKKKAWRRLTNFEIQRTKTSQVVIHMEASFSETERPRILECHTTPQQALEIGIALQETGKKCLRVLREQIS